jgi:anti-anti-sigma factor
MGVAFNIENGNLICRFPHSLDTAACTALGPEILSKLGNFDNGVVFDLSQVDYVSSAFLRICLIAFKKVGADKFSIINVSPLVKKVFKITGFDQCMKIE